MEFRNGNKSIVKEIYVRDLDQSEISQTTDGKVISTLNNVNYQFNRNLMSVKILQDVKSLNAIFEENNKFILKN